MSLICILPSDHLILSETFFSCWIDSQTNWLNDCMNSKRLSITTDFLDPVNISTEINIETRYVKISVSGVSNFANEYSILAGIWHNEFFEDIKHRIYVLLSLTKISPELWDWILTVLKLTLYLNLLTVFYQYLYVLISSCWY